MKLEASEHRLLVLRAADLAELVLPYFENQHPQDQRPRQAIAAARAWARGEIAVGEARAAAVAAHAAAREATDPPARAAARAAGHAAATAQVASHAPHVADFTANAEPKS